jgi:hypothetical protein
VLRYCQLHGDNPVHQVHARWALHYCFYQAQQALLALCRNFPIRPLGWLARLLAFPLGQTMRLPSDRQGQELANLMSSQNEYRQDLIKGLYLNGDPSRPIDRVENAMQLILNHDDLYQKIADLRRCKWGQLKAKLQEKVERNELTAAEMEEVLHIEQVRWDAIQVDEFKPEALKKTAFSSVVELQRSPVE